MLPEIKMYCLAHSRNSKTLFRHDRSELFNIINLPYVASDVAQLGFLSDSVHLLTWRCADAERAPPRQLP